MGLKDTYDFESLVNEAENMVLRELEAQIRAAAGSTSPETRICTCQDCVLDMAAAALNNVKPAYRVSLMGSVYAKSIDRTEHGDDIKRAVRDAIRKVRANPSHD